MMWTPEQRQCAVNQLNDVLTNVFEHFVWDDSSEKTAERILRYWESLSYKPEPLFKFTTFEATSQQMIIVRNIEFSSACAHHLLPFYGVAHVAYLPHKHQVGLSKIPRMVKWLGNRPQVQERLTTDIAKYMQTELEPKGTAVVIHARHTCMSCRGVQAHNGIMTTSELRGIFLTSGGPRTEFFGLIGGGESI